MSLAESLAAFQDRLSLTEIRCVHVAARLEGDVPVVPEMATVTFPDPKYLLESGRYSALIEAELVFSDSNDDPVARVGAGFVVDTAMEPGEPPEDEVVSTYVRFNTFFLAYPYLREALQSASVRVGMPPMPLPMLDRSESMPELIEIVRSE